MKARLAMALSGLVLLGPGAVAVAPADPAPSAAPAPATLATTAAASPQSDVDSHRAELDAVTANIAVSQDRQAELQKQIDGIDTDRASLDQALIDAGAQVEQLEAQLDQAEQKLSALLTQEQQLRGSLAARRDTLSEVLAALQRMGDHPPPALLVRPEDALSALQSAILLGAVVPDLRSAADQLSQDLAKLVALQKDQEQARDRLKASDEALLEGRAKIALLLDQKAKQRDSDAAALTAEQRNAASLATQATSLRDLLAGLDSAKTSAPSGPAPNAPGTPPPRSLGSAGRLAPAVAFADAKGLLPIPANGRIVTAFGAANGVGEKAQGISLATRSGAAVLAPCDGTVEYAGAFRSYGQLLIINAGGGYHVILAGMDRIDVQLGQFVLAGEPLAAMASQQLASAGTTLVGTTEPVLYVEFRKDGASIDPAPWWAASNPEKVGG
jgi:septal ring factor EnvC (AmiA/AmiB activator)